MLNGVANCWPMLSDMEILLTYCHVRFDSDCVMFSAGEDGQVKVWSCTGMLRSTLAQNGTLILLSVTSRSYCMRYRQEKNTKSVVNFTMWGKYQK